MTFTDWQAPRRSILPSVHRVFERMESKWKLKIKVLGLNGPNCITSHQISSGEILKINASRWFALAYWWIFWLKCKQHVALSCDQNYSILKSVKYSLDYHCNVITEETEVQKGRQTLQHNMNWMLFIQHWQTPQCPGPTRDAALNVRRESISLKSHPYSTKIN